MNADTARRLEEVREGLTAARHALDRLEARLADLEEGLRSDHAPATAPFIGDRAGAEPDLEEFSLGVDDGAPDLPTPRSVSEAPEHEEPSPGAVAPASFDQDELLKDLFAGTPPRPSASAVSADPPGPFAASPSRAAEPQAVPSDDALEAILKSVHAPDVPEDDEGLSSGAERSSARERREAGTIGERATANASGNLRIDFSTEELEELFRPDRR